MPASALEQKVLGVEKAVQNMMAQYKIEAENGEFIKTIRELLSEKKKLQRNKITS